MPETRKELHFFDREADDTDYKKYHANFKPKPQHRATAKRVRSTCMGKRTVSDLEIQSEHEMDSRAAKSGRARVLGLEHGNQTRQREITFR